MHFSKLAYALPFIQPTFALGSTVSLVSDQDWQTWINKETPLAFERIIENIGRNAGSDVMSGGVIASPSKHEPDYFYQWTRDAGITINSLVTAYDDQDAGNQTLQGIIDSYIDASYKLQRLQNPSGGFDDLTGLGEPKFEVDGSAFTGDWGRPQRDGPAFRSITMINYCNSQIAHLDVDESTHCNGTFHDVIKYDLEYTSRFWGEQGFDYWEEVEGMHLATSLVQLRSMELGVEFAKRLGYPTDAYEKAESGISDFLSKYYDSSKGYLVETLDKSDRTGLDAAVLVGAIQSIGSDGAAHEDYAPYSDLIINHLNNLVDEMRSEFNLNDHRLSEFKSRNNVGQDKVGIAIGRYKGDVYDGAGTSKGNPWFLCTSSVAETLYILAQHLHQTGSLTLSDHTKQFYAKFNVHDNISSSSASYKQLITDIQDYADSFMDVVREHQSNDGRMSEQFNRDTGFMQGAHDLTWSYGAFWSASRQRQILLDQQQ